MIVVDLETSGLDSVKNGIWQIGAVDLDNPENLFLEESRVDDEDEVSSGALRVIGKTELELRDKSKQSQKQLLENFFKWCEGISVKNCVCQNPQFDMGFLDIKTKKYGLSWVFHYRSFDLHSIASLKYFQINKKFLIKQDYSNMGLGNILSFVGMQDNRGAHNALEDAKLTAECFSRIFYGKGLFSEYDVFLIPEYLKERKDDYV